MSILEIILLKELSVKLAGSQTLLFCEVVISLSSKGVFQTLIKVKKFKHILCVFCDSVQVSKQ